MIGDYLQENRLKNGIQSKELAKIIDVSKTQISRYETNRSTPPIKKLIELKPILKLNLNDINNINEQKNLKGHNLGEKLKNVRLKNNLTQEEFAQKFNLTKYKIHSYENNIATPNINTLIAISNEYKIPIETFLENEIQVYEDRLKQTIGDKTFNQGVKGSSPLWRILEKT
ncbi:helix-turn-helix domain-containing protein [Peptococcus niger]|uniref:Helix-turn-helix n=1 Tax=Peptococcus niger TaxID=2741 RepID=A0A1G6S3U8_PEPNI|nr:helix-turn-helix transcriptional regulator [Peptococcus niger]SDD11592.1 Helix-turn-helix [Peptococcus niger]